MHIYPYKPGSKSARALCDALGARMIKHEGSRFRGGERKQVINWGSSQLPEEVVKSTVLNRQAAVVAAGNKLTFFNKMAQSGVSTPSFTSSTVDVINWLEKNYTVVARHSLTGHSGHGIEIIEKGLDIPDAPLYTVYIPKDGEYRVHIVKGEVIDVQRKVKDPDRDVVDWKVRSHKNGFIFIRNDEKGESYLKQMQEKKSIVLQYAEHAFRFSGLDFAAIDVIYNKKRNAAFVLEANCAPGLEGHSVEVYANAFKKYIA